jgi:hypothetical protein
MANTISLRANLSVQFNLDTTPLATPLTLLANRQFDVVDWAVLSTAADLDLQIQALDTASPANITVIGRVENGADATWFRPTQSGVSGNTGYLAANALVIRGGTLRLTTTDDADKCQGTITILPGNRYGATVNTAYYANNSAATRFI